GGGFNHQLGDGHNRNGGAAAALATLGLMQEFDFKVMVEGYRFLRQVTPKTISNERFPYYGHFYGLMGMRLLGQEYKDDKEYSTKTAAYIVETQKELLSWQGQDGSFPLKGWIIGNAQENAGYATGFGMLGLG